MYVFSHVFSRHLDVRCGASVSVVHQWQLPGVYRNKYGEIPSPALSSLEPSKVTRFTTGQLKYVRYHGS